MSFVPLFLSMFLAAENPPSASWRQWGGPNRNFIVEGAGLAENWPASGPPVLWSRPLGTGHSAILSDEGRLYTNHNSAFLLSASAC